MPNHEPRNGLLDAVPASFSSTAIATSNETSLGWAQIAKGPDDESITGHVTLDDESILVAGTFSQSILFNDDEGIGPTIGVYEDTGTSPL